MYMTNFRRFIVLMGLTLTLLVGSFASPAFAQPKLAQIGDVAEVPPNVVTTTEFGCDDWGAYYQTMPGSKSTLRVDGICIFPTGGYSVKLVRVNQQNNPPGTLTLEADITKPLGLVIQVITHLPVSYSEETDIDYTTVQIGNIKIPIQKQPPVTAPTPVEPNDFTLSGIDTTIHYSTTSLRGLPQFNYNGRQFSGNEIASLDTAIGKLVTVLIEPDSDGGREVLLTLLLPTINLPSSIESPIQTTAILTTKRTVTRGDPRTLEGQIETYKTLSLTGTARRVDS